MNDLQARVRKGAALLDRACPVWFEIEVDELAMHDGQHCILGLNYGSYGEGLRVLAVFDPLVWDYGFSLRPNEPPEYWDDLDDLWREQIALRDHTL